jgi:hypothetical protein
VSKVTPTNAVLEAQLNPGGLETGYEFHLEYGCGISPDEACPFYCLPEWESCSLITSVPLPEGQLPPSSEAESVSLDLNEAGALLQPGTKYRYWIEAANGAGATEGSKEFFITPASLPPAGSAPTIEGESVSAITETNATLEAVIDSGGLPTSYEFHLWRRWKYELAGCEPPISSVPLPGGELPASASAQPVSLDLNSAGVYLYLPNFYEYWVTATNTAGSAEGPVITFASEEADSGGAGWKPPSEWEGEPQPQAAPAEPTSGESHHVRRLGKGCGARRKHHHPGRRGLHRACVAPA